ncbi:MAG: 50S ribosomal protein L20 [Candidatus Aceula lacicola]|nr:50S ribosomal protein L20 [Candidatus Aceula lacicola]
MTRATNAVASRKRKKRVLKQAKGQFGHRSKRYQQADRSLIKGMAYAYRDRRVKKREIRSLWIARINAACRDVGLTYSRFINGLKKANIEINRQMLAELAVNSPVALKKLIKIVQEAVLLKPAPKETKTTEKA